MTPSPNVEALAAILRDLGLAHGDIHGEPVGMPEARALASRGVLATEALTDEQCFGMCGGECSSNDVADGGNLRAALARLARGEP